MRLRVDKKLHHFLKCGGIIAYATESCFGLGCDPNNRKALTRLIKIKQRDATKGMIVIGAHIQQLAPFLSTLSAMQRNTLRATWPAAHTWVVPASASCDPLLTGGKSTIAVRIPDHRQARSLCQKAGMALVSTSANLSGQVVIKSYLAATRKFAGRVKVISGCIGHHRKPSTIQDLVTGKILRR